MIVECGQVNLPAEKAQFYITFTCICNIVNITAILRLWDENLLYFFIFALNIKYWNSLEPHQHKSLLRSKNRKKKCRFLLQFYYTKVGWRVLNIMGVLA